MMSRWTIRARAVMGSNSKFHVGCSGWSYEGWVDKFYPADLKQGEWLGHYAQHFNTVEVNMSFYRFPFKNMLKGWYNRTPKDFLFTLKANRMITHVKKLQGTEDLLASFYSLADLLKEKLACVLFQMPPSLTKDKHLRRFEAFLKTLPPDHNNAVEFRHKSWFCSEVYDLLTSHNATFCILSAPGFPSDAVRTGNIAYVRFHGVDSWYDYHYRKEELREWAVQIRKLRVDAFCYFNNDANAYAPFNALELEKMLAESDSGSC
jgi:uncharacterized protein YecE (DUF72 family)